MAKVQNVSGQKLTVPILGRDVEPDDVVEVDDDLYESFVPPAETRSPDHPWSGIEAPDTSELRGKALDEALKEHGLPTTGTADEKRDRLAEALVADTEEN